MQSFSKCSSKDRWLLFLSLFEELQLRDCEQLAIVNMQILLGITVAQQWNYLYILFREILSHRGAIVPTRVREGIQIHAVFSHCVLRSYMEDTSKIISMYGRTDILSLVQLLSDTVPLIIILSQITIATTVLHHTVQSITNLHVS